MYRVTESESEEERYVYMPWSQIIFKSWSCLFMYTYIFSVYISFTVDLLPVSTGDGMQTDFMGCLWLSCGYAVPNKH